MAVLPTQQASPIWPQRFDACELMNVGVNYLREHMIQEARIHYAYRDAGGGAPNVVQDHAALYYFIRAPKVSQAVELRERVDNCARGAALMSGTTVEIITTDGLIAILSPTEPLAPYCSRGWKRWAPRFTGADRALAAQFQKRDIRIGAQSQNESYEKTMAPKLRRSWRGKSLMDIILPLRFDSAASLDLQMWGVSYVCPTAQLNMATMRLEPRDTWQLTAQSGCASAMKGCWQRLR